MPKGVEHIPEFFPTQSIAPVNGSEMPKGVEHSAIASVNLISRPVNGSEMPKGVEHKDYLQKRLEIQCEWI